MAKIEDKLDLLNQVRSLQTVENLHGFEMDSDDVGILCSALEADDDLPNLVTTLEEAIGAVEGGDSKVVYVVLRIVANGNG